MQLVLLVIVRSASATNRKSPIVDCHRSDDRLEAHECRTLVIVARAQRGASVRMNRETDIGGRLCQPLVQAYKCTPPRSLAAPDERRSELPCITSAYTVFVRQRLSNHTNSLRRQNLIP